MTFSRLIRLIGLLFLFFHQHAAHAEITPGGTGMLFGYDHAFRVSAADGWVLDNQSAAHRGLHMLFYPEGYNWGNSPVIVYGRSVDRPDSGVEEHVQFTVEDFKAKGSPEHRASPLEPVTMHDGRIVPFYRFDGDQWGNVEAGAYFLEKGTLNYLVFNARTEADYRRYLNDFKVMVRSYENAFMVISPRSEGEFALLVTMAEQHSSTEEGKDYETRAVESLGPALANIARGCSSFFSIDDVKDFQAVFRISPMGDVAEVFTYPSHSMATCVIGMVGSGKFPPHGFADYLFHLNMRFQ